MIPRRAALGVLLALAGSACRRASEPPPVRAKFGVFFGGQVQEREELPLIVDRTRQSIGVRLEFETPPAAPARISWELEKPSAVDKSGKPTGEVRRGFRGTSAGARGAPAHRRSPAAEHRRALGVRDAARGSRSK